MKFMADLMCNFIRQRAETDAGQGHACHTELEPEEFDENGEGMTLTCIGFRPLPDEIAHQISHKFHLY